MKHWTNTFNSYVHSLNTNVTVAPGKNLCWRNQGDGHTNQALIPPVVQSLLWWLCTGNINITNIHPHSRSSQCLLAFTQPNEGRIGACHSQRWALTAKGFLFWCPNNGTCSTSPSKWKCVFEWEWKQEDNGGNEGKGCTRGQVAIVALLHFPVRGSAMGRCNWVGWKRCQRLCWL